jgi:hypothetical protein
MGQRTLRSALSRRRHRAVVATALAPLIAAGALMLAGFGAGTAPGHGLVVGHLQDPFRPAGAPGNIDVVHLNLTVGERFSIKVDRVDFPDFWAEAGARPDPRIVHVAGDIDANSCPGTVAGCAISYFHVLVARSRGTTTMTWKYEGLSCKAARPGHTSNGYTCPAVTLVTYDITIR